METNLTKMMPVSIENIENVQIGTPAYAILKEKAEKINLVNTFYLNAFLSKMVNEGSFLNGNKHEEKTEKVFCNAEELAKHLGTTRRSVISMARHKEIPAAKIPPGSIRGEWKFCAEDVDKALMVKKEKSGRKPTEINLWGN